MAKEVKILQFFAPVGGQDSAGRNVDGQFCNYDDFPDIEAEIGRYLADGYSIVSSNRIGMTIFVTLQR